MEVFIDGSRAEHGAPGGSLKDTLMHVQSKLCEPDHIVVGIRCDGHEVAGEDMAATLEKPAEDFARLEVFTSTRKRLVIEAMTQASVSLQETETACQRVVELLTEGDANEAIETLGQCLRIWQQIHDAVGKSIQTLGLDAAAMTIKDEPLMDVVAQPKETLLQVKQALQAQDYVLLSDVLQYEFGEVTDRWYALIARIRREAEET